MKRFILRWLANFIGLWVAASLVPGIDYGTKLRVLVWAALIFSIVNALIRPLLIILSLPAIVLSFGLFTFLINAFMLYMVTVFYPKFQIDSFGTALLAVLIVGVVNWLLNDTVEANSK